MNCESCGKPPAKYEKLSRPYSNAPLMCSACELRYRPCCMKCKTPGLGSFVALSTNAGSVPLCLDCSFEWSKTQNAAVDAAWAAWMTTGL